MAHSELDVVLHLEYQGAAFALCIIGWLTAISFLEQRRRSSAHYLQSCLLEVAASVSIGFVAIWAAGLCLLTSFEFTGPQASVAAVNLDRSLEVLSCVLPIILTELAILVSTKDPFFAKSSEERSEMIGKRMKTMSIKKVQQGGIGLIIFQALTSYPAPLACGGLLLAFATLASQATALVAMTIQGGGTVTYPADAILATVLIMIPVCSVISWVLIRVLQWKSEFEVLRLSSSIAFAVTYLGTLDWILLKTKFRAYSITPHGDTRLDLIGPVVVAAVALAFTMQHLSIYRLRRDMDVYQKDVDGLLKKLRFLPANNNQGEPVNKPANLSTSAMGRGALGDTVTRKYENLLHDVAGTLRKYSSRTTRHQRAASEDRQSNHPLRRTASNGGMASQHQRRRSESIGGSGGGGGGGVLGGSASGVRPAPPPPTRIIRRNTSGSLTVVPEDAQAIMNAEGEITDIRRVREEEDQKSPKAAERGTDDDVGSSSSSSSSSSNGDEKAMVTPAASSTVDTRGEEGGNGDDTRPVSPTDIQLT